MPTVDKIIRQWNEARALVNVKPEEVIDLLIAEIERLRADKERLRKATIDLLDLIESNELVRNTEFDDDPRWVTKAANMVMTFKRAYETSKHPKYMAEASRAREEADE